LKKEDLIAPEQYNIAMEIEKYAEEPEKLALIFENEDGNHKEVTYKQLIEEANRTGNVLAERGLKKGDKLLVMMPRMIETYEVYIAALKLGVILIPSSEMLRKQNLEYRINHGGVSGIISYYEYVDQFNGIAEGLEKFTVGGKADGWDFLDELKADESDQLEMTPTARDDVAFLPYTSGTTGPPKAVMHTHAWGYAHMQTAPVNWLNIKENDRVWATAAPGWQKWVWSPLLSVLGSGAAGFVYNGKFSPSRHLELLEKQQINVLCCTPTEYRLMAKVDGLGEYNLENLHSAVSAGEPLNKEVIDQFERHFGITVRDGYGQTENTLLLGFLKGMKVKPGSMGKPTPGNNATIIDEEGLPVEPNVVGDIAVPLDTPALFKGYYKEKERTLKTHRGDYYVTGDQAYMDEDGYFWFHGRSDDIIISSGYTIGPFEVEDALIKHPKVKECAVVPSPDSIRGNVVKAFIVLKNEADQQDENLIKELQNYVKQNTAPYKYPRKIEFIDELPKTSSGKVRRIELRELEKNRAQLS